MSVAIDFGNSKIKIGLFSVDGVQPKQTWTADYQSASFSEILAELPDTEYCIYSQVRHEESLTSLIERRFSKTVPLHYQLNLPFGIDYGTPETLGNDRIASCAGAMELFADRPLLVIDAGTCITYDLISVDNRFMGGAISPGIEMKLKAMAHFTDKLPKATLSTEQEPLNIGKSTIECLLTGAVMGTIHEISGFVATFGKQQSLTTVLTGGDSQYLADNLENSTFAAPNLVLIGLNKIGKLNA